MKIALLITAGVLVAYWIAANIIHDRKIKRISTRDDAEINHIAFKEGISYKEAKAIHKRYCEVHGIKTNLK